MGKPTELRDKLSRRVEIGKHGPFVVTITSQGVRIRKFRKRRSVFVPWDRVVREGLQLERLSLTEEEWSNPLKTMKQLAQTRRASNRASRVGQYD